VIRRFLVAGAVVAAWSSAALVGAAAYQALRNPVQITNNGNLTPENCSPRAVRGRERLHSLGIRHQVRGRPRAHDGQVPQLEHRDARFA